MSKNKLKLQFFSFLCFFSIISIFSCEIGLGSSVDTKVPEIEIESPNVGAIIRDEFSLLGNWSDDGTIKDLQISLKTVENDGSSGKIIYTKNGEYTTSIKEEPNKWICTINPTDESIKDGKYEAIVAITDTAGHTTTVTRQITIDNTAPVVVLQRPGTDLWASAEEMDSYGQHFTIEGQAADDSNISYVDVKIYGDRGLSEQLDTVRLNNVPPTISLDVAKWGDEHYAKIYGSREKEGTKSFWCEIEAYDSAQRYPSDGGRQSAEDTNGNCERSYYLYEEIATSVLSEYKITELYKIKNGTYEESGTRSAEGVKALLEGKARRAGSFNLNPDNSPTFSISGREALEKGADNFADSANDLTNGSQVIAEVSPGLDATPVKKEGLKIYAIECDENCKPAEGAEKIYPKGAVSVSKSGTNYKIITEFTKEDGLEFGKTYLFGIDGEDENGNGIVAKGYAYGFRFATSGRVPEIKIDSPDDNEEVYIARGGKIRVKGSVNVESGVAELELYVNDTKIAQDKKEAEPHELYTEIKEDGGDSRFEYEIDCSKAPFDQDESRRYTIRIRASQGKAKEEKRSVTYDVEGPKIKNYKAEPLTETSLNGSVYTGKVNGKLRVSGELYDGKSGVKDAWYKIEKYEGGEWKEHQGETATGSADDFNIEIQTREIDDTETGTTPMRVTFRMTDNAGNETVSAYEYTVDQKSDRPQIKGTETFNIGLSYEGLREAIRSLSRENCLTKGATLVITVSDDDGLADTSGSGEGKVSGVKISRWVNVSADQDIFEAEDEDKADDVRYIEVGGNPTNLQIPYSLETEAGSYRIRIEATDKEGEVTGKAAAEFYVQITGAAPDGTASLSPAWISTRDVSELYSENQSAFTVKIKITDGAEPLKILRKLPGESGFNTAVEENAQLNREYTDVLDATKLPAGSFGSASAEGSGKIEYKIVDSYTNGKVISTIPETYRIDNVKPAVSFTNGVPTTSQTENATLDFKGRADDGEGSGIAKVEIKAGNGSWSDAAGSSSWNYTLAIGSMAEGQVSVKVRAIDVCGNISSEESQSFMLDKGKPEIKSIKWSTDNFTNEAECGSGFDTGKEFKIKVSAKDTNVLKKAVIYENGVIKETITLEGTEDEKSGSLTYPTVKEGGKIKTGSYTYRVAVYDGSDWTADDDEKAKKTERNFTVHIDCDAPEISISGPADDGAVIGEDTYAFGGSVKDKGGSAALGVEKIYYRIVKDGENAGSVSWKEIEKATSGEVSTSWSAAYSIKSGTGAAGSEELCEGKYTIYAKAADRAGNESEEVSRQFYADKKAPDNAFDVSVPESGYINTGSLDGAGKGRLYIKGRAGDTHGIAVVSYTVNGGAETDMSRSQAGSWKTAGGEDIVFEYGVGATAEGKLSDGTYTVKVTAEDLAGRKTSDERTWTIDTKTPVISGVKGGGAALTDGKWFTSRTVSMELTASDPEATGSTEGSGILAVEYSLDGNSWSAFTKKGSSLYGGAVEFNQAEAGQRLYLRAEDKAGNKTAWPAGGGALTVNIDESNANLDAVSYETGGNSFTDETIYINGEKDLTVYGTYSDPESGAGELTLTYQDGSAISAEIEYAGSSGNYAAYSSFDTFAKKKSIARWKAVIGKDELKALRNKPEGKSRLSAAGSNGAGNITNKDLYSLKWDETAPVISGITLKYTTSEAADAEAESGAAEVYKDAGGRYYMNPTGKYLLVRGNASDTNGLSKVDINVTSVSGSAEKTAEYSNESWGYKNMILSGNDGDVLTVSVTAEDRAGNQKTESADITVDKSAPIGIHLLDRSGKDVYFRIGSNDNDENEGISSGEAAYGEKDQDVGGKYKGGTFGNASTIVVRGKFIDVKDGEKDEVETATEGSGVKNVYCRVYSADPKKTKTEAQILEEVKGSGQLVTLKKETKRVFFTGEGSSAGYELKSYNVEDRSGNGGEGSGAYARITAGGYLAQKGRHWKEIETTFKDSVTGFDEGTNWLVFAAEDNAGNCALDITRNVPEKDSTGTVTYETNSSYHVNVDNQVPSITSQTNETVYTNLEEELEIILTAKDTAKNEGDKPAGIRSIVVEVGDRKIKEEDSVTTYGRIQYLAADRTTAVSSREERGINEGEENGKEYKEEYRKLTLTKNAFTGLTGNITVYATVSDDAGSGNSQKVSVATVNVDEAAPFVEISGNEIKDADSDENGKQVNRTIKIGGSSTDGISGIKEVLGLCYYQGSGNYAAPERPQAKKSYSGTDGWVPEGWHKIEGTKSGESNTSRWSFEGIDTEKPDGSSAVSGRIYVTAAVKDNAGNTGYAEPQELIIDQHSDRPKITFSNMSLGTAMSSSSYIWLKNTTKIIGTVSDDDGVSGMQISLDGTEWKDVTVNGSSFSYDLKNFYSSSAATEEEKEAEKESLANGSKTVYFRVTDAEGNEFESKGAKALDAVILYDGTDRYGKEESGAKAGSVVYVKVDTKYPEIELKGAKLSAEGDSAYTTEYMSVKLGGANRGFDVKFTAKDGNGIDEGSLKGSADFIYKDSQTNQQAGVHVSSGQAVTEAGLEDGYRLTFTLTAAQAAQLAGYDGSVNIKISGKDMAGNESSQTASVVYDFAPSQIAFSGPDTAKALSGAVTAYGTLSETAQAWYAVSVSENAGPGQSAAKWTDCDGNEGSFKNYALNPAGTVSSVTVEDWNEISDASLSWAVNFDNGAGGVGTHAKSLNQYLIDYKIAPKDTGSIAQDGIKKEFTTVVSLWLWIKTADGAGNEAVSKREFKVDPQGDRPQASISYPDNKSTLGGNVKIYGTAADTIGTSDATIGVDSVWVQIKSTTHRAAENTAVYGASPSYTGDGDTFKLNMTLTAADLDYMVDNGYAVFNMNDYNAAEGADNSGCRWIKGMSVPAGKSVNDYAAHAELRGTAWNLDVNRTIETAGTNELAEFDPPSTEGNEETKSNPVGIRVFARDKDKKLSINAERYVEFDADTPQITNLYLVQSSDGKLATASTASRQYTADMYVKDDWYLTGTATDKDCIKSLQIGNDILVDNREIQSGWTDRVTISNGGKEVRFKYPLATGSGVGTVSLKVSATDAVGNNPHKGTENIAVRYDNLPPSIAESAAQGLKINESICQTNSWYTFGSSASELSAGDGTAQSGFAYTVFYLEREDSVNNKHTLYDVLQAREPAKVDLTGVSVPQLGSEGASAADNTIVKYSGIYWYKKTAGREDTLNTFTVDDSDAGKKGIRKNALISIGGALYLITDVNGNSVTIDGFPEKNITTAYVAVAAVIDNTTAEGAGTAIQADGYYESPKFDDGDRMMESVVKSGTTWQWEASICSRNISDGPVKLHYIVFDKAGNCVHEEVEGMVSNNRPRIAGVTVKTDYNGNGSTEDLGETIENYSYKKSYREYWTAGTEDDPSTYVFDPDRTVKNSAGKNELPYSQTFGSAVKTEDSDGPVAVLRGKTVIQPEIVGGNGAVYYSYKVNNGTQKNNTTAACIASGSLDYTARTGNITVQLGDLLGFGDTADASTGMPFYFRFWDSTEGTVKFNTANPSQTAELTVYFAVQAQEVGTPQVNITPFYWKGIKENSVYASSTAKKYSDLKGHIELEGELPSEGADKFTASDTGNGLMDRDPKVSGKIVIEGTAHDDKLIRTITAEIFGTEYSLTGTQTHATKKKALAEYSGGQLVSNYTADLSASVPLKFEMEQSVGKDGHDVSWKLSVDTEKAGGLGLDQGVMVYAENFGIPSAVSGTAVAGIDGTAVYADADGDGTADITYSAGHTNAVVKKTVNTEEKPVQLGVTEGGKEQTAYYRMDIVPYIREVRTSLSEVNSGNPTVYSRTALGHYPVYASFAGGADAASTAANYAARTLETVRFAGFNLDGCSLYFENDDPDTLRKASNANALAENNVSGIALGTASDGLYSVQIPAGAASGHVYAYSGSVKSLNNLNANDAHGSAAAASDTTAGSADEYAGYYNRQPNGVNNNRLTDDVYIDVWEFNSEAAKAYNNGRVDNLEMKINPTNGMLGFAFSNGSTRFAMPKSNNSYQQWNRTYDYMSYNALAYDSNGYTYALTVGGDISSGGAADINVLMTSRWGWVGSGQGANKGSSNTNTQNHLRMESIGQQNPNDTDFEFRKKNRFQSQSLATRYHDTYTDVFHAYYDFGNDEIRLKAGTINTTNSGNKNNAQFGNLYDRGNGASSSGTNHKYSNQMTRNLVIAKNSDKGDYLASNTLGTAGPYVSVGVTQKTTNPVVVIVWFDGSNLQYAYATYTYNDNHLLSNLPTGTAKNGTNSLTWTVKNLTSGGEYCQLAVGSDDSIHIAAYDSLSNDLKYIYIPSYSGTPVVTTVDAYLDVGTNLTIDVAKVGDNQIPYIGYAASEPEQPRYAYLANPPETYSSESLAGVSGDFYTGVWECTVVPTTGVEVTGNTVTTVGSKLLTNREISIGLWKNSGELAYSTTGTTGENGTKGTATGTISYTSSYAKATTDSDAAAGVCYGNGSKNGVLAYVVKKTAQTYNVETAQKR